jgi:hypothetical protein
MTNLVQVGAPVQQSKPRVVVLRGVGALILHGQGDVVDIPRRHEKLFDDLRVPL